MYSGLLVVKNAILHWVEINNSVLDSSPNLRKGNCGLHNPHHICVEMMVK